MSSSEISLPTYETMLVEAIRSIAIDVGLTTSTSILGGNTLSDSTKFWAADIHRNRLVKIIRGAGAGQNAVIQENSGKALIIVGVWTKAIAIGDMYIIVNADYEQMMRDVFGGGANISAANPLPVDTSAGVKAIQTLLTLANLAAGATSVLANCTALDLRSGPWSLALTVVATYNAAATLGLRVHVRSSPDNVNYDSEDWDVWTAGFLAGATLRETENYMTDPLYLRVLIENLDPAQIITNLSVIASVGA